MYTEIYPERKAFNRYDTGHFLVYLNEVILENHLSPDADEGVLPATGYQYTGTFPDGGTLIPAQEATYDNFVSGLVRSRYSADQVEAILLNVQSSNQERMPEFISEFNQLNAFREECKQIAAGLLQ